MLVKVTRGNQVTIPREIVKRAHIRQGQDYLDVEYVHGAIHMKPVEVEERVPDEVYEKLLEKASKKEPGDKILSAGEARGFLKKRSKA
ncbi:MAG: AbrB/MazE/SpoVT family DNA-binding domain-containing protein [Candidatus Omnitrophica bacterium]|nr:AbrB/MazE/SpoVT family DNA-binding domain-containing protein [Candidatus Omnitrophota bacterium]